MEGVIKDFGPVFFPQGVALCSRAGAGVNHWATERHGIDVVVNHLNDQPTRHGVKDFLGVGVGVTIRELDLFHGSWSKQHLRPFEHWLLNVLVVEEDTAAIHDTNTLTEDRDRPVIDLHLHFVLRYGGQGRGSAGIGKLLKDALDVLLLLVAVLVALWRASGTEGEGGRVRGDGVGR